MASVGGHEYFRNSSVFECEGSSKGVLELAGRASVAAPFAEEFPLQIKDLNTMVGPVADVYFAVPDGEVEGITEVPVAGTVFPKPEAE